MKDLEDIAAATIDVALRVHRELGPGLLESVYETVLAGKPASMGYLVARQIPVSIEFESMRFADAFRIDILIEDRFLVEVKSAEKLNPVHGKQLLTYLRLTKQPLGLLINFGGETLKEGIKRVVNDYRPSAPSRLRVNK